MVYTRGKLNTFTGAKRKRQRWIAQMEEEADTEETAM